MNAVVLLCAFMLCWAKCQAQELCPVECDCTHMDTKFSVFCRGESLVNITKKVPSKASFFHYEALEMEVDVGTANFSHLTSLESLCLSSPYDNNVLTRMITDMSSNQQRVFWPLQKLKELKININWELNASLPELFGNFHHLETLDLSATRRLNYKHLITSLAGFPNSTLLRVLNLHNTQTFQHEYNGFLLNISELLKPLQTHQLEELDISYNALRTVVPGLIRYAPNLKKLKAHNNMLIPLITGAFFMEIMLHPSLIEADVSEQGLGEPVKSSSSKNATSLFIGVRKQSQPQFSNSRTQFMERRAYQPPKLPLSYEKCYKLSRLNVCNILSKECEPFIKILTDNHELFCSILETIVPYSSYIPCDKIPPIKTALKRDCGGCFVFPFVGNVRIMHLQRISNYDEVLAFAGFKGKTRFNPNNSLEFLDFSQNREHGYADVDLSLRSSIVGFDALQIVNFSKNRIQLPSPDLGHNLPHVEVFDFSFNLIDLAGTHGDFLAEASTMKELNLAGNVIQDIPYTRFADLYNLQVLNLSRNSVKIFNVDIRNLSYLSFIDLSYNRISSFPVDMMHQLTSQTSELGNITLKIDLSYNPLTCTCEVKKFVQWVHSANIEFVNFHNYTCIDEHTREVPFHMVNPKHMHLACLGKDFYIGVGVGSGIFLSIIIAGFIIMIYKKRWCIRYHYYIAKSMLANSRNQAVMTEYQYDLFISHNRHDKEWIEEILQPMLEDEHHIKLCLHERDFELGEPITEQIIGSIENSRKTLLVLSPHFVQSNWCMFEMDMAQSKLFTKGQDVLLLAILKPLDNVEISKTLRALLEKKTYVEWSDNPFGQKLFWAKLIKALEIPKEREENRQDDQARLIDHEVRA